MVFRQSLVCFALCVYILLVMCVFRCLYEVELLVLLLCLVVTFSNSISGIFTLALALSNSISVFFVVMVMFFECCLGLCNYISIKCFSHAIGHPAFARVK